MSLTKRDVERFDFDRQLAEIWIALKALGGTTITTTRPFENLLPRQQRAEIWDAIHTLGGSSSGGSLVTVDPVTGELINPDAAEFRAANHIFGTLPFFVDPATGDDGNVGTSSAPLETLQGAADKLGGSGVIIMRGGTYTHEQGSLNAILVNNLEIRAYPGERVKTFHGEKVTTFVLHSGAIWKATITTEIPDNNDSLQRIFEWDTPFGPINDAEKHPLHKGRSFRLEHTPFTRRNSVEEITGAGEFFFDNTKSVDGVHNLFLRTTDSATPNGRDYWVPKQGATDCFVYGGQPGSSIRILGIESYFGYRCADLANFNSFKTERCTWFGGGHNCLFSGGIAGNVNAAVLNTGTISGEHIADQILAAADDGGVMDITNGDTRGYVRLTDCFVSDNGDEGYNPHSQVDLTIDGGLYSNNRSGGITIPLGSTAVIKSVETRSNGDGTSQGGGISVAFDDNYVEITEWTSRDDLVGLVVVGDNSNIVFKNSIIIEPQTAPIVTTGNSRITAFNLGLIGIPSGIIGGAGDGTANPFQNCYIQTRDQQYFNFSGGAVATGDRGVDGSITVLTRVWVHTMPAIYQPAGHSDLRQNFRFPIDKCRGRRFKIRALWGDFQAGAAGAYSGNVVWRGVVCYLLDAEMQQAGQGSPAPGFGNEVNATTYTFTPPASGTSTDVDFWKQWVETDPFTMPIDAVWATLTVYRLGADGGDTYARDLGLLEVELVELAEQG